MKLHQARIAIENAINIGWDDRTYVVWDDLVYTPIQPNPYIRVSVQSLYQPADGGFIGSRYYKMHGVVTIQIFTESGVGRTLIDELAEAAITILRGNIPGITLECPSAVTAPFEIENGWQSMNVIANFYYFDTDN